MINFDASAALEQMVREGMPRVLAHFQVALDAVHAEYAHRPVQEVKPALISAWAAVNEGAEISDPELSEAAEAISRGERATLPGFD